MVKLCLNPRDKGVIELANAVGLDPTVAADKIGTYLDSKYTEELLQQYIKEHGTTPLPVIEEFKDYLGIDNNSEISTDFVKGKQLQKLTQEEKAKTIEQVTREHRSITALKDLSAKLANRIGGKVKFENRTGVDWKGYNKGMTSVLNEAYMTPDTPFHEILAHPIIRAIKNIEDSKARYFLDNEGVYKNGNKWYHLSNNKGGGIVLDSIEEVDKFLAKENTTTLYQNLIKELETGKGKEVFEQVKRDYNIKGDYTIFQMSDGKWSVVDNNNDEKYFGSYGTKEMAVSDLQRYTSEEQQEEAIVTLLGLMAADKLDAKKDATLISKLKELWKQISDFVKSLLRQDGIKIDELPITTTLNDLAEILGYGNNKIILPGYKVEYQTPLGNKYDTLEEVNNEIRGLADANVEVDLENIKLDAQKDKSPVKTIDEIPVPEFYSDMGVLIKKEGNNWVEYSEGGNWVLKDVQVVQEYNNVNELAKDYSDRKGLNSFIEKNKEYEQSKEIIEQWKKENNIQYDPEEVYSRGQGFYSSIGAYSNLELDLLLKNLIQHIQDNKKAGGEFTISAFTKPIDKRLKHIEGTGDRVRFAIYPKSEHIKWAASADVYSGSVWDAHEKVSKDKKSELLGVSFTKAPSLRNIDEVSPNLADIIDNISYAHNELGIELTTNNFRIEYDDNIDYSTKKLIDNINKILDDKYGKLDKVEIKETSKKYVVTKNKYGTSHIKEDNKEFDTYKEAEDYKNELENKYYEEPELDEDGYPTSEVTMDDKFFTVKTIRGKQPTQTRENTTSIESVKTHFGGDRNNAELLTDELKKEIDVLKSLEKLAINKPDDWSINNAIKKKKSRINELNETIDKLGGKKEYTSQALTNLKVAALKEVARKYPRSLITSKVVPINANMANNSEIQYSKVSPKHDIDGFKDFVNKLSFDKELAKKIQNKLQELYPEIKLNITNNPVWEQGDNIFDQKSDIDAEVQYRLKAADILLSDKAKEVFNKGEKNKWSLDKILTELAIPKEQKKLLLDLNISDREDLALELTSRYSYNVEINTAKERGAFTRNYSNYYNRFAVHGYYNLYYIDNNHRYIKVNEDGDSKEITKKEYDEKFELWYPGRSKDFSDDTNIPTQHYSNLTVPGGTNYTENEISTPLITPSIKGHAQFSTDKGIGWFRSDEQVIGKKDFSKVNEDEDGGIDFEFDPNIVTKGDITKTRRILEVQSDLFQKGRSDKYLISNLENTIEELGPYSPKEMVNSNQFLQLLNKDNNWVTFFIKSIIQDSAKKGYEKVLFPKGETAAKIEGHVTIAEEIRKINYSIENIEDELETMASYDSDSGIIDKYPKTKDEWDSYKNIKIKELEQKKANLKSQGIEKLKPIEAFYEIKVGNILEKQLGKDTIKTIIDEYGNQWREITINQARDLQNILLQKDEANRIIGLANIKAMTVLIDAINQKQDTLPHEYAHHYIAWNRSSPIVQEAISKWGSEEALVEAIGKQAIVQKGEAWAWWKKFVKWLVGDLNKLFKLDKESLTKILTDAFLTRQDLTGLSTSKPQSLERLRDNNIEEIKQVAKEIFNIKDITISNPLDKVYRPLVRIDRAKLIAREFSRVVSGIQKQLRPNSTRELIISEFGADLIFQIIRLSFYTNSQNIELFNDYQRNEFEKLVDNFDLLIRETPKLISKFEDVSISFEKDKINIKKQDLDNPESLQQNEEGLTVEEDENESVRDGWMIKHRFLDPNESLSLGTRKILMNILELDEKGEVRRDDMGFPKYLNQELAHNILILKLSSMTNASLMIPMLEELSVNKPWIKNIITTLQENKRLHSMFYQDFRKAFMPYWVLIRSVNPDGSFYYKTRNINKPDGYQYFIDEWRTILDSNITINDYSLYNENGNIDRSNVKEINTNIDNFLDNIKGKSIPEINQYVSDNIGTIKDILGSLGIDTEIEKLIEALTYNEPITSPTGVKIRVSHPINILLNSAYGITNKLNNSYKNHKTLDFLNTFENEYKNIANTLITAETDLLKSSVYENSKSYYSYSSPSYLSDLITKLKGTNLNLTDINNYYNNEFGRYNWFNNGQYRNEWLKELATDPEARDLLQHKINLNFNKVEYSNLTPLDHTLMMINEYYSDKDHKTAFYPVFILADAPSGEFIKFKKFTEETHEDWQDHILEGLFNVALLEYDRIKIVRNRQLQIAKGLILPIENFDKNGDKFHFLPYLNQHIELIDKLALQDMPESSENLRNAIKQIIKDNLNIEYEKEFRNYEELGLFETTGDDENLKHLQQFSTIESAREGLKNYFWNMTYAQSQMLQLTITDIAYYKDVLDMQKRMKEIHTPGYRLDTTSQFGRNIENTIYLKTFKSESNSIDDIEAALDELQKKGNINKRTKAFILNQYKNVDVTDALAYRSLSSYRALLDMSGAWTSDMQEVFDKLKAMKRGENVKLSVEDFNIIWQPKKPFVYTLTPNYGILEDKELGIKKDELIKVPTQNKNAEFLLTFSAILNSSPQLSALEEFMEEEFDKGLRDGNNKGIDVVLFETTVKVGKLGVIDLNPEIYQTKEQIKLLLIEATSSNVANYNPQVVHALPYEDYMLVLPVPSHYMDTTNGFGTQIRKLIIADLSDSALYNVNGKSYNKKDLVKLYSDINVENLMDSFYRVYAKVGNKENFALTLLEDVVGNERYSVELAKAVKIAKDGFNVLPLSEGIQSERTLSMANSIIRNTITKLKTKGGSLVHVTSWGVHDDLKIVWGEKNGKKYIEKIECYMPCYSNKFLEALIDPETGFLDIDALDEKGQRVLPEELRKLIGYRIPTENKYSMFPLYIKGFLPNISGGTIMMPKEVTTIAGLDFDVDKLYVMLPEFNITNRYDRKSFTRDFLVSQGKDADLEKELYKIIKDLTYKENIDSSDKNEQAIFETWLANREDYKTGIDIKKVKYQTDKLPQDQDIKARNNQLIDIMWGILTNPDTVMNMVNPGNFDSLKKIARIITIMEKAPYEEILNMGKYHKDGVWSYLELLSLEELNDLAKDYKQQINPLSPFTLTYFHKANHTAGKLIGIFANHNSNHALMLYTKLGLKELFSFLLDNKKLTTLNSVKNKNGLYISRNTSEFVSASVDAVKDPVLSDLNLDTFTADIAMYLIRLGHTHETVGLWLSLPIVKKMSLNFLIMSRQGYNKRDIVSKTINDYFKGMNFSTDDFKYTGLGFSNADLARSLIIGNRLQESTISDNIKTKYYELLAKIASLFLTLLDLSLALSDLVSIMRADTSNGGAGPTYADTDIKLMNALIYNDKTSKKFFPLENARVVSFGLLHNKDFNNKESRELIRDEINKSTVPFILANFTLGLESSEILLSQYYPYALDSFRYVVRQIRDLTMTSDLSKGSINAKLLRRIYDHIFAYAATQLEFFGGKNVNEATNIRDQYINNFPQYFEKVKLSNPEIMKLDFINRLKVIYEGNTKVIVFRNVGSLSPTARDGMILDWESLLSMGNEAKLLALDLFKYAYFRNGFAFGPSSFIHLSPVNVRLAIPEYRRFFTLLNYRNDYKTAYKEFLPLFLMNNRNIRKIVPEVTDIKTENFINKLGEILLDINIIVPPDLSQNGQVIVRIDDGIDLVKYPLIMKKLNNKEYYYAYTGLENYDAELQAYVLSYRLIEKPLGKPNKFMEYYFGQDAIDLESVLKEDTVITESEPDPELIINTDDYVKSISEPIKKNSFSDKFAAKLLSNKIEDINKSIKESNHIATNPEGQEACM